MTNIKYILLSVVICLIVAQADAVEYNLKTQNFRAVSTMVARKQQTNQGYQTTAGQYRGYNFGLNADRQYNVIGSKHYILESSDQVVKTISTDNQFYYGSDYSQFVLPVRGNRYSPGNPKSVGFVSISRQNILNHQIDMPLANFDNSVIRSVERPDEEEDGPQIGYLEPLGDCPIVLLLIMVFAMGYYIRRKTNRQNRPSTD